MTENVSSVLVLRGPLSPPNGSRWSLSNECEKRCPSDMAGKQTGCDGGSIIKDSITLVHISLNFWTPPLYAIFYFASVVYRLCRRRYWVGAKWLIRRATYRQTTGAAPGEFQSACNWLGYRGVEPSSMSWSNYKYWQVSRAKQKAYWKGRPLEHNAQKNTMRTPLSES
jgi:hypothetical protein